MKSIFVSSTFRDMQFERDLIQTRVLPELNEYAREYGESLHFTDLRWGVNTTDLDSEQGAEKILSVCLDQIDHCKPYMVILLGERYGWVPSPKLIEQATNKKKYITNNLEKSVTALEIEYGALSLKSVPEHCLFYFRELSTENMTDEDKKIYSAENSQDVKRLNDLKQEIKNFLEKKGLSDRIKYYKAGWDADNKEVTGIDNLGRMICNDVKAMMEGDFVKAANLSWQQKERQNYNLFVNTKCHHFLARNELIKQYIFEIMYEPVGSLFILQGMPGSGMSTIVCKLAWEFEQKGYDVFTFICGNSSRSSHIGNFIEQAVYFLEEKLERSEHFGETSKQLNNKEWTFIDNIVWTREFHSLLQEYREKSTNTLVFVLDGLDQLSQEEFLQKFVWSPEKLPDKVKVIASCQERFYFPIFKLPYKGHFFFKQLTELTEEEKHSIIMGILKAEEKELAPRVIDAIKRKREASNPLYISLLLQRIMMLDKDDFKLIEALGNNMEAIDNYTLSLVESAPDDLNGICTVIIQEAGERINEQLTRETMAMLAASRNGLKENDLFRILQRSGVDWSSSDFAILRRYMHHFFCEREDGRIDFTHQSIREGLREDVENIGEYNLRIVSYLKELPDTNLFKLREIIYNIVQCDDKLYFLQYIKETSGKEKNIRRITAKEVKEICMVDNGEWLGSLIRESDRLGYKQELLHFISNDLLDELEQTWYNLQVIRDLFKEYLSLGGNTAEKAMQMFDEGLEKNGWMDIGYDISEEQNTMRATFLTMCDDYRNS